MFNGEEVKSVEIKASDYIVYRIREVILDGDVWIDLRKWRQWVQDKEYHPESKGFFARKSVWRKQIMPAIRQFIESGDNVSSQASQEQVSDDKRVQE